MFFFFLSFFVNVFVMECTTDELDLKDLPTSAMNQGNVWGDKILIL